MRQREGGFTLIELMVVLVILASLLAIVGPAVLGSGEKGRRTAAQAQIASFRSALDRFQIDMHRVPTAQEGLDALITKPVGEGADKWAGPYLRDAEKVPVDPWDKPYVYRAPGQNGRAYDIISYARDGKEGGEGDDKDITSWLAKD